MNFSFKTICFAVLIGFTFFQSASADLNDGLQAYYKLDGNAIDETGNHDGAVTGTSWVPGVIGSAASFNGISDYITMGVTRDLLNTPTASFSFWVKFNNLGRADLLVSYDGGNFENGQLFLVVTDFSDFNIQYGTGDSEGHHRDFHNPFSETGVWYHVAVVLDSTRDDSADRSKLYVNGLEVVDSTLNQTNDTQGANIGDTSDPFRMAHWVNLGFPIYWAGQMDEVRIYDRVLTPTEVRELATISPTALSEGYHIFDIRIATHFLGDKGEDTVIFNEKIQGILIYNGDTGTGQLVYTDHNEIVVLDTDFSYTEYINTIKERKEHSITKGVASAHININGLLNAETLGRLHYQTKTTGNKLRISLTGAGTADNEGYGTLQLRYNQKNSDTVNNSSYPEITLQEIIESLKEKKGNKSKYTKKHREYE